MNGHQRFELPVLRPERIGLILGDLDLVPTARSQIMIEALLTVASGDNDAVLQRVAAVALGSSPPGEPEAPDRSGGPGSATPRDLECLGVTRTGEPRHPLYVKGTKGPQ